MQQVNSTIRNARLRLGLTLVELAERCGDEGVKTDNTQLSRYERYLSVPRPRLRAVLSRVLDVDVTDFKVDPAAASNLGETEEVA